MPANTVFLHAGLPKTGTSAIQKTAFAHREALEQAGVRYWSVADRQSWPLAIALDLGAEERGGVPESRAKGFAKKFGRPAKLRDSLIAEIETAADKFLISSEKISVFSVDTLRELRALVGSGGAAVKVVAYVREPRSLISSAVQQNAKVGIPAEDVLERLEVLPYQGRVGRLIEAFGEEDVLLRLYKRGGPGTDSLFADFLRVIGVDPALAEDLPMDESNSSMSARAAKILDGVNRIAKENRSTTPTNWFRKKYLLPHFQGSSFQVDPPIVERLIEQNIEQITWMSDKLGIDLLSVAPPSAERPPQPEPIDDEMARFIYALFSDLARLRVDLKRAEATKTGDEDGRHEHAKAGRQRKRMSADNGADGQRATRAERIVRKKERAARKEERGRPGRSGGEAGEVGG